MNIMISGLTASGKTTHSRILSRRHGLEYVSGSKSLLRRSGISSHSSSTFWGTSSAEDFEYDRRANRKNDRDVDAEMVTLAVSTDNTIFDTWALPWLTDAPAFRIYLASSEQSRITKALISYLPSSPYTYAEAMDIVRSKDEATRDYLIEEYAFDIFRDLALFDLVLDISKLIVAPTRSASRQSVKAADELVGAAVSWALSSSKRDVSSFHRAVEQYGKDVVIQSPQDLLA